MMTMQKRKLLSFAIMALAMSFTFVACGDDDNNNNDEQRKDNQGGIVVPGDDTSTSTMSSIEQKEKLEKTALDLMAKVNANDFKELTDLGTYVRENLLSRKEYNYNTGGYTKTGLDDEVIEDWFESALESCFGQVTNNVQKNLYIAANFKARFVAGDNAWKKEGSSDGLEFVFNDDKGQKCVLKITASDSYTKAHFPEFDSYDYDNQSGDVKLRYENTFGIPKEANASLTCGSKTLAQVKVTTQLTMKSSEVNLSSDSYTVTANVETCGYQLVVDKAQFVGGKSATASVVLKKNGTSLVTLKAEAAGKLAQETYTKHDKERVDVSIAEAGKGAVSADVLGQVQLIGEIKSIDRLVDYMNTAEKNRSDETACKKAVENANNELNIGLFFDGKSTRMASYKFLVSASRKYDTTRYEAIPAVFFGDGTSYSFEDYFDETYFKKVIQNFENLVKDFENLVED